MAAPIRSIRLSPLGCVAARKVCPSINHLALKKLCIRNVHGIIPTLSVGIQPLPRIHARFYCKHDDKLQNKEVIGKAKTWRQYAIIKYMSYINWYFERFLEKRFPTGFKIFRTFKDGTGDFFKDFKVYYKVSVGVWSATPLDTFTWRQLDTYGRMPTDMLKVAPVLLVSALPFGPYFIFPIAYLLPRYLLSRQFWSNEQEFQYASHDLKYRLSHYTDVLQALQTNSKTIPKSLQGEIRNTLQKLKTNGHPTTQEILALKPLFKNKPFSLEEMSLKYSRHLSKCMAMSLMPRRLKEDALVLWYIDKALLAEDWSNITENELKKLCFTRGLNPIDLDRASMLQYLHRWTTISQKLDEQSLSLLLHMPVFITINNKNHRKYTRKLS